jgi:hypothetical protein
MQMRKDCVAFHTMTQAATQLRQTFVSENKRRLYVQTVLNCLEPTIRFLLQFKICNRFIPLEFVCFPVASNGVNLCQNR